MTRSLHVALLAASLVTLAVPSLHAQSGSPPPPTLSLRAIPSSRPLTRCSAYDALMAGVKYPEPGPTVELGPHGTHLLQIGTPARFSDRDKGVVDVSLVVRADSGAPPDSATVEIMAQLVEQDPGSVEERQGSLMLDDTATVMIGSMSPTPGATFPNGVKSWYLYAFAPRGSMTRLARAQRIEFLVGSAQWRFPADLMARIRGGLVGLTCGR